jgi:LacI family transcriptional regulator
MALRLKDIAKLTGFSTATVSRVLNNDPRISDETRKTVLATIAETGYTINPIARSLKTRKTDIIGFIAPELTNDFFMSLARGAEQELTSAGYSMILCNSQESVEHEKKQLRLLTEKWVDGILIIPVGSKCAHYAVLKEHDIPFIAMDRVPEDIETDAVLVNNIDASRRITEAVIQKGHTRIGFIGGNMDLTSAKERYEGYRQALKNYHIPYDDSIVQFGDFHIQSGADCAKRLLELSRPPDFLYIANFYMHIGAVKYLMRLPRRGGDLIPRIASFDEMEITSALGFSDISAAQPMEQIGREAAALILRRIQNDTAAFPKVIRLPATLIDHTTTKQEENVWQM